MLTCEELLNGGGRLQHLLHLMLPLEPENLHKQAQVWSNMQCTGFQVIHLHMICNMTYMSISTVNVAHGA